MVSRWFSGGRTDRDKGKRENGNHGFHYLLSLSPAAHNAQQIMAVPARDCLIDDPTRSSSASSLKTERIRRPTDNDTASECSDKYA
jgi:hypothetical protein